jgi:predicted GNAT family N-acyltransferase
MMHGAWLRPDLHPDRPLEAVIGDALRVRRAVFVAEQGFPADTEPDGLDALSRHAVIYADREPVAAGRLWWADGDFHVGRVCVLAGWRGQGVGDALMRLLLHAALEHGARGVTLGAQEAAMPFYARYGFAPDGPPYAEDGVAHRRMRAEAGALRALFDCRRCARRDECGG